MIREGMPARIRNSRILIFSSSFRFCGNDALFLSFTRNFQKPDVESKQQGARTFDFDQLLLDALARCVDRVAHRNQLVQRGVDAVMLQPQALPQHFMHRVADRILVAAHDRLDLDTGGAQALLERVGGVQHLGHGALAAPAALPQPPGETRRDGGDEQQQQDGSQTCDPDGQGPAVCRGPRRGANAGVARVLLGLLGLT